MCASAQYIIVLAKQKANMHLFNFKPLAEILPSLPPGSCQYLKRTICKTDGTV